MSGLLRAKNVVNVENIITVLIVVPIILGSLARFSQHPTGVAGGLVFEARIAYSIRSRQMNGKSLERLQKETIRIATSGGNI